MLTLAELDANHVQTALLSKGGFAWWYVDLIDPQSGAAAVLLWSFGLPFLPDARRRGVAEARPAISLATYRDGRRSFYLLQEPDEAWMNGGAWCFGRSRMRLDLRSGAVALRAELDLDVPGGGRIRGSLELEGARAVLPPEPTPSMHRWAPIAPCARGRLELEGEPSFDGRAYFDGNASHVPLDELEIRDWRWGRVAFPDHDLIFFFCDPEGDQEPLRLALTVDRSGRSVLHRGVTIAFDDSRRSFYGLRHPRAMRLGSLDGLDVQIDHRHLVDEGPFYLRFLTEARDFRAGVTGLGSAERVVPSRIDLAWQRPFVSMRRHRVAGDNSIWLPLFSGPREGRFGRLLRHWAGEGA